MPQLWLTFEEIADLFYCDTAGARRRVIANQWERRRYSDGVNRALLPPEVAHEFMLRYKSKHESVDEFDAAMAALRRVFSQTEVDNCGEDRQLHPSVTMLNSRAIGSPYPSDAGSPIRWAGASPRVWQNCANAADAMSGTSLRVSQAFDKGANPQRGLGHLSRRDGIR